MAKRSGILDRAIASSGHRRRTWFDSLEAKHQKELLAIRREYHDRNQPCSVRALWDECKRSGIPVNVQRCQFERWLKEGCDGKRG